MTVLAVSQVRRRLDLFRCDPYHATISAGACLARQAMHARGADPELVRRGHEPGDYSLCSEKCLIGAAIKQQVSDLSGMSMATTMGMNRKGYMPPVSAGAAFLRSAKTSAPSEARKPRRKSMKMNQRT